MQPAAIRSVQVILLTMIMGVLTFVGITVFVRTTMGALGVGGGIDVLTWVVPVLVVTLAAVYFLLRRSVMATLRGNRELARVRLEQGRIPPELQRLAILGAALAEGWGLFGTVVVLIGGPWYLLAAPGISVLWIACLMPTRDRMESLLKDAG